MTEKIPNVSPELTSILFSVLKGNDYAQKIAADLNKSPSTLVRQLQKLEKIGMINSKKEKLLNKTIYNVDWGKIEDIFLKIFDSRLDVFIESYKEALTNPFIFELFKSSKVNIKRIKKDSNIVIKKLFNKEILKDMLIYFLKDFSIHEKDLTLNQAILLFFRSCADNFFYKFYKYYSEKKDISKMYNNKDVLSFMSICLFLRTTEPSIDRYFQN